MPLTLSLAANKLMLNITSRSQRLHVPSCHCYALQLSNLGIFFLLRFILSDFLHVTYKQIAKQVALIKKKKQKKKTK